MKPFPHKSYGSIGHLPNSRLGPADHCLNPGQTKIATVQERKGDKVIVQQKLDGSNVAIANVDGKIIPVNRAGHDCNTSKWLQHKFFANWVYENYNKFTFLEPNTRICGEWLALVHGTRYILPHEPFVAFDIIKGPMERLLFDDFSRICAKNNIQTAQLLHVGGALSVEKALELIVPEFHGAYDPVEGAVWRVENKNRVDFLTKFVRQDKIDGKFFDLDLYNWHPEGKVWHKNDNFTM